MDNCYVPVHAHEGYEENAAIKTCVVNARHYLTHSIAKNPLVWSIVGLERKGQNKQEIRGCEVQQADVSHCCQPFPGQENPEDQGVSQEAEDKHKAVEDWEKEGFKPAKVVSFITWSSVFIVSIVIFCCAKELAGGIHLRYLWRKEKGLRMSGCPGTALPSWLVLLSVLCWACGSASRQRGTTECSLGLAGWMRTAVPPKGLPCSLLIVPIHT